MERYTGVVIEKVKTLLALDPVLESSGRGSRIKLLLQQYNTTKDSLEKKEVADRALDAVNSALMLRLEEVSRRKGRRIELSIGLHILALSVFGGGRARLPKGEKVAVSS